MAFMLHCIIVVIGEYVISFARNPLWNMMFLVLFGIGDISSFYSVTVFVKVKVFFKAF
jgi:hypothetical protein